MSEPMNGYPYDPDVLDEVVARLYSALPAMVRVPDAPPAGRDDLKHMLEVLAAPLAVIRQSIEELNADLFIDTAADRIVPYLAQMVGTDLVFPDADSNRRDVRGTVGWRRRKGTPTALEEMGGELTGQLVVVEEGWKRIQLAQDLNLVRAERVAPDLRPAVVAEEATGPLDALFHAVDIRKLSARTGRYHPKQVAHWLYPTITFPLREATAFARSVPDSDVRFAMHPLGVRQPLRTRRPTGDREPFVDRIQEEHFAAAPEGWFGRDGGFTIRVCSLQAGVAGEAAADRVAVVLPAGREVSRGNVTLTVLEQPDREWRGPVRIELGLAGVSGAGTGAWHANPGSFSPRGSVDVDVSGTLASAAAGGTGPGGTRVVVLRVSAIGSVPSRFFPGGTIEVASDAPEATAAALDPELAREGFLRGVLNVTIPPLDLRGDRFLYLAADGSVFDLTTPDGTAIDMPEVEGAFRLAQSALRAAGPGAAWPPLLPQAEPTMLNRLPAAPGRGPAVLHGARPLRAAGGGLVDVSSVAHCALVFAVQIEEPGGPGFRPFQRLAWDGPDPSAGTWCALDENGQAVGATDVATQYRAVATEDIDPSRTALAVRFECSEAGATLCPCEVAWSADDGRTVLIHLPQLDTQPLADGAPWATESPYTNASEAVRVAEDGSTWASESTAARRSSLGNIAPIAQAAGLRRRRVHGRRLCGWDNEDWSASPPETLALTRRGRLDVDVLHGLFAFSADEPPQQWPALAGGATPPPPSVTVDYEEGATMHIGALPAAREPVLDVRLARPTRLVSRSGALHPDAPADYHSIPRYDSLQAALSAIALDWQALTVDDAGDVAEIVQFEDSATYGPETLVWPRPPGTQAARRAINLSLTVQAAERERPTLLVQNWTVPASDPRYVSLTLHGIAFGAEGWAGMSLPPSTEVAVELCTVLFAENLISFADLDSGTTVRVTRCVTGGLELAGGGTLSIEDSIVDAQPAVAVNAPVGEVELERVSVGGETHVRRLEASEVIFDGRVRVQDRFHGCVRYSRVPSYSTLPRLHRVVWDTPVRLVSRNRRDPAWWRLRADADTPLVRGAENGSELGAFALNRLTERIAGFERRVIQFTPAGLDTGIIRVD